MEKTNEINLLDLTVSQLAEMADNKFEDYLPSRWQGCTMAQQLAVCTSKIVYRWFNDGDEYDKVRCQEELWTFANRIHNRVFKLKRDKDYETNLKYLLINAMFYVDRLTGVPAQWDVYEEQGTWYRK